MPLPLTKTKTMRNEHILILSGALTTSNPGQARRLTSLLGSAAALKYVVNFFCVLLEPLVQFRLAKKLFYFKNRTAPLYFFNCSNYSLSTYLSSLYFNLHFLWHTRNAGNAGSCHIAAIIPQLKCGRIRPLEGPDHFKTPRDLVGELVFKRQKCWNHPRLTRNLYFFNSVGADDHISGSRPIRIAVVCLFTTWRVFAIAISDILRIDATAGPFKCGLDSVKGAEQCQEQAWDSKFVAH